MIEKFKHLSSNSCNVFIDNFVINLYVSQHCDNCGHSTEGYYRHIREPQHFKCPKCAYEWSICTPNGENPRMDKVEKALMQIDDALEQLNQMDELEKIRKW